MTSTEGNQHDVATESPASTHIRSLKTERTRGGRYIIVSMWIDLMLVAAILVVAGAIKQFGGW